MLLLLARYWYIVAIAVLLAALGGQHWFYKNEVAGLENEKTVLTLFIKAANLKEQAMEEAASALTKRYHESLANQFAVQAVAGAAVKERIKKNEETKRIALSADIVSLFNDSKPATKSEATPPAVSSNAGGTGTPEAVTLNVLLLTSAENDANHLRCIAQVHEWQHFWKDTEASVQRLEE